MPKVIDKYGTKSEAHIVAEASSTTYAPLAVNEHILLETLLPVPLAKVSLFVAQISRVLLIDLFPLVGILVMYVQFRKKRVHDLRL